MSKIKVAVVGVGHLGSLHAKIYREIENCSLVAVCDTDKAHLNAASQSLNGSALGDGIDWIMRNTPSVLAQSVFSSHRLV